MSKKEGEICKFETKLRKMTFFGLKQGQDLENQAAKTCLPLSMLSSPRECMIKGCSGLQIHYK